MKQTWAAHGEMNNCMESQLSSAQLGDWHAIIEQVLQNKKMGRGIQPVAKLKKWAKESSPMQNETNMGGGIQPMAK